MSVNSHRHVQFPRGQHSKSCLHSGSYAAKETSYVAKVEKVSPESGGFAAGALSYYYDDEMRSERENYQYYQEQVRHEKYRRVQLQSRTQQNSLYELEISPKGRSSDYYHPRTDYFREEYHQPECQSPSKKFSFHSTDRSPHRSFSRMDYCHNSSPVNKDNRYIQHQRSTIRYPYKEESLYLERKSSPESDYKYKQRRKRTPSPSSRQIHSRRYGPSNQRSERKRSSSRRNRQHNRPNERRVHSPSPSSSRPHRHQRSNQNCSSGHSRTGKSHSPEYKSRHRKSKHVTSNRRRYRSPVSSSSPSGDDSSSGYSNYSSDESDSLSESSSSDESAYSSSDNSSPERHRHSKSSRNRQKSKHPDRHCHKNYDKLDHRQDKRSLQRHHHRQDPSNGHQHRQRRFPLTKQYAERIYTDEQGYTQEYVPRNQELIRYKATRKTVKAARDPLVSDIINQHLIFQQRCDRVENMLKQLLERSSEHPPTRNNSQSLNWKGLCL